MGKAGNHCRKDKGKEMKTSTKMWIAYYMGGIHILILNLLIDLSAPAWVFVVVLGITILLGVFIFYRVARSSP